MPAQKWPVYGCLLRICAVVTLAIHSHARCPTHRRKPPGTTYVPNHEMVRSIGRGSDEGDLAGAEPEWGRGGR